MRMVEIIEKKRDGKELSELEIQFWVDGVTHQTIPDYQTSALLMAIVMQSMTAKETAALTQAMMYSGDVIDLSMIDGIKADKHSTGGVGDKTSLSLGPMVAACGLKVAKMSGRGLGHTGGTLDKLESIPGFNCFLKQDAFIKQVNDIGIAIIGQTASLVPADKKLYALRDVTGTVNSIPLIASSIMSKKLASGSDTILLDVKFGEGAFMHTPKEAEKLAHAMIAIGKELGRNTVAIISDMNQPLGNAIGNALEVREAIATLCNEGPDDFMELCLQAGEIMLKQGHICQSTKEARQMLLASIDSGQARAKLRAMVAAQSGDTAVIDNPDLLPKAVYTTTLVSKQSGWIADLQALELGVLAMRLGAGREKAEDSILPGVGIVLHHKKGSYVSFGDVLATIHSDTILEDTWEQDFYSAYLFSDQEIEKDSIIYKIIA